MQITREKLSLLLALDYIRTKIHDLTADISSMNVLTDNVGIAFDERKSLQDIASVIEIRLGYVYKPLEGVYSGSTIEDAGLVQRGFMKRLDGI